MSNDLMQRQQLPAELQELFGDDRTRELISSTGGFPVLSIRGKAFRVKTMGEEKPLVMRDTGDPLPSLELVLLDWQKGESKLYYENVYKEGDDAPPACFSNDGVYPDASARAQQATSCAACRHNVWGSKITPQGKKAKACSDSKRLAVTFASDLPNESLGGPMLLRVPPASLRDLSLFAQGMAAKGFDVRTIVARIGFDITVSYPKLTFKAVRALRNEEAREVAALMRSPQVAAIMGSSQDVMPAKAARPAIQKAVDTDFDEDPFVAPAPVVAAVKPVAAVAEPEPAKARGRAAKPKAEVKPLYAEEDEESEKGKSGDGLMSVDDLIHRLESMDSVDHLN